jgi:hypothetical protein
LRPFETAVHTSGHQTTDGIIAAVGGDDRKPLAVFTQHLVEVGKAGARAHRDDQIFGVVVDYPGKAGQRNLGSGAAYLPKSGTDRHRASQ